MLQYNKVCEFEDFADSALATVIRDVFRHEMGHFSPSFPQGAEYRKYWEVAMAIRALQDFGAMRADSTVLGVGAGTEATIYYLANHVRQVFATDLYLTPGVWGKFAPGFMLAEPEAVAPYKFDQTRLVVQHMDARFLRYPDDTFDGIFSSSSIEHFGSMDAIANAAYEMGRVLKPGGILSISTEFYVSDADALSGPALGNVQLFTRSSLQKSIVEASGLEAVDVLDTSLSPKTMASKWPFSKFMDDLNRQVPERGRYPRVGEVTWSRYPHILLETEGHLFTSVHLTLRKVTPFPKQPNLWAKPDYDAIMKSAPPLEEARPSFSRRLASRLPARIRRSVKLRRILSRAARTVHFRRRPS